MGVRTMHEFTLQLVLVSVHKIHQILHIQGDDVISFNMTLYRWIKGSVIEWLSYQTYNKTIPKFLPMFGLDAIKLY